MITVIIPVYNAGERLQQCVESLLRQTVPCKILMVLDCPTDGTDRIAEHLAADNHNIQILRNTENLHIGLSRNRGIEVVTTPYLTFVDHDDICHPMMLELLLTKAQESDADIVFSVPQTTLTNDPLNGIRLPQDIQDKRHWALCDILSSVSPDRPQSILNTVIGSLYRTSLAKDILFEDTREVAAEDRLFNIRATHAANKVEWIDQFVYLHCDHDKNEGKSKTYLGFEKRDKLMQHILRETTTWSDYNMYASYAAEGYAKQALELLNNALHESPHAFFRTWAKLKHTDWIHETSTLHTYEGQKAKLRIANLLLALFKVTL